MIIDYSKEYPIKHLSIRVPWHDNAWNGTICSKPSDNSACLALLNCAKNRNDAVETQNAGLSIQDLDIAQYPPCISERATFMADFAFQRTLKHIYQYSPNYQHIGQIVLKYPKYSAPAIPFAWLNRKGAESFATKYALNFKLEREPSERGWIQEYTNQKAVLDCFFQHVRPDESMCFFYAKEVPFVEGSNNRILIGIGKVLSIVQSEPYPSTDKTKFNVMPWEHMVNHSIKPDFEDGFLLPYHDAIEYQKTHPDFDPQQLAVIIPNEFRHEFSYATEHISHDFALYVLRECLNKIQLAQKLGIGKHWEKILQWIEERLGEIEILRGDYPGLAAALSVLKLERPHFLAQFVFNQVNKGECPWSFLSKIFESPRKLPLPSYVANTIHSENVELWHALKSRQSERFQLLQLISRFSLSPNQAKYIYDGVQRNKIYKQVADKEILENPYLIYEISIKSIEPISYATIDMGLMLNRDKSLLPQQTKTFHPLSKERVRALTIMELENQTNNGHTLYPETELIQKIAALPIEPKCDLSADHFNIAASIFDNKILTHFTVDKKKVYQLKRYDEIANLINQVINKRMSANALFMQENWDAHLSTKIAFKNTTADKKAKAEKVKALEAMATARFSVLIGQAGSGKTTLLAALVAIPKIQQGNVLFLAPTGKAKVRMEEKAKKFGVTAKTIAQLLRESGRFNEAAQTYQLKDSEKERGYKTVVIDECSMLTEEMLAAVFQHLDGVERLILVGDYRQLPPIGAGRPFFDIINYIKSKNIDNPFFKNKNALLKLTASARQVEVDDEIRLDTTFANIFGGEIPLNVETIFEKVSTNESKHIKFYQWTNEVDFEGTLFKALKMELNIDTSNSVSFNKSMGSPTEGDGRYFHFKRSVDNVENWQLLSPVKASVFGTMLLNRVIHRTFKQKIVDWAKRTDSKKVPKPLGQEEIVYGDKVINLKNHFRDKNYLANGEIGIAISSYLEGSETTNEKPEHLEIEFSSQKGYKYKFKNSDFSDENGSALELAYALTIHKAQGSQFNTVILVIPKSCLLLSRELIYTALSRQVDKVIVLYQDHPQMLYNYSSDAHSATLQRLTNLFYKPNIVQSKHIKNKFFEGNLIHCASDGQMLRSKSEVIIYETLLHHHIKPIYEYSLEFNGTIKRPDFYIEDVDGINYYWEHLGMLSTADYAAKWEVKLKWYRQNDILPYEENENGGANGVLIITEDVDGSISVKKIVDLIKKIFKVTPKPKSVKQIEDLANIVLELRQEMTHQVTQLISEVTDFKKKFTMQGGQLELLYKKFDKEAETVNIQTYYEQIEAELGEISKKLEDNSRKFLAIAFYLKEKLEKMDEVDYSPFILQYARVIENEILQKMFLTFYPQLDKLENKVDILHEEINQEDSKSKIFATDLSKRNDKITLGTMQTIIGFVWKSSGETLKKSKLFQMFRSHLLEVAKDSFLTKEHSKSLAEITTFRNKAAHVEPISIDAYKKFLDVSSTFLKTLIESYRN